MVVEEEEGFPHDYLGGIFERKTAHEKRGMSEKNEKERQVVAVAEGEEGLHHVAL